MWVCVWRMPLLSVQCVCLFSQKLLICLLAVGDARKGNCRPKSPNLNSRQMTTLSV